MRRAAFLTVFCAANLWSAGEIVTTQYNVPTPSAYPQGLALGADGNLWFTETGTNKIGRFVPSTAVFTEFTLSSTKSGCPWDIISGPDGALWYTDACLSLIGRITTAGVVTNQWPIPTPDSSPRRLCFGPDGALYFGEYHGNNIGRMTIDNGEITEYPIPTRDAKPSGITNNPDGLLWIAEGGGNQIVSMTTAGVFMNSYPLPTPNSVLDQIVTGPDNNLWAAENLSNKIARLNPTTGQLTEWVLPTQAATPSGITNAPDGALWFTEWDGAVSQIGRITTTGVITQYPDGTPNSQPWRIVMGPEGSIANGAIWYTEFEAGKIGTIPVCALGLTASYSAGAFDLGFNIGSTQPWTWTTWLTQNGVYLKQLWSVPLPAESPLLTKTETVPFASTGGNITVVSGLFNASGTLTCEENATVNTAAITPAAR